MKCVTICQPWPWCILRAGKRVENRTWTTSHRGDLLLHAGLSQEWLGSARNELGAKGMVEPPRRDLVFGAIVGMARLVDCVTREAAMTRWPSQQVWICGPYCWVLEDVREFQRPVHWRGAQGLFEVPDRAVAEALGLSETVRVVRQEETAPRLGFGESPTAGAETLPELAAKPPRVFTGNLFFG